jgi:hypothetical protein
MPKRKYLRIDRIAHEIQPGASNIRIVPDLFARTAIGDYFFQSSVVPEVRMIEDHRNCLEVPFARSVMDTLHKLR